MRKKSEYALYKGDTFIDIGTAEELAKKMGVKPQTIRFYCKPSYLKRIKNIDKDYISIKLD